MKKYLIGLIICVAASALTGCHEFDDDGPDFVYDALTSQTWVNVTRDYLPGNVLYEGYDSWQFNIDGTGYNTIEHVYNDRTEQITTDRFDWWFTTYGHDVICIDFGGYDRIYWLIDNISYGYLGVYESVEDPAIHPGIPSTYWEYTGYGYGHHR